MPTDGWASASATISSRQRGNSQRRAVGAAIVDDDVVPVLIGLGANALDALRYVLDGVLHRGDDADECGD